MKYGRKKYLLILLAPITWLLFYLGGHNPALVEKVYSRHLYGITQGLSTITGVFPFSVGECLIIAALAAGLVLLILFLKRLMGKQGRRQTLGTALANLLLVASLLYCAFILLWGLNYDRETFARNAGYTIEPAKDGELMALCQDLVRETNQARLKIKTDARGVMILRVGRAGLGGRLREGYQTISERLPVLGGSYGLPKYVHFSTLLSYADISGVYFPYTGEANLNFDVPDAELPFSAAHEMAHQRGFAREDEANFIAYLVCKQSRDPDIVYSGLLNATVYAMNALEAQAAKDCRRVASGYSKGVLADLVAISRFWKQYRGKVQKAADRVSDLYLKTNAQADGINSYGRVVDLLLAEYRAGKP